MKVYGGCGRSSRHYARPLDVLIGVRFCDPLYGYPRTSKRDAGQTVIKCGICGLFRKKEFKGQLAYCRCEFEGVGRPHGKDPNRSEVFRTLPLKGKRL